mgnify:CR=1 FL=1
MRALSSFPNILVFRGTPDFRKRRQSLATLIQSELGADPFSATLFVFMNRRRDCVRTLYWEDRVCHVGEGPRGGALSLAQEA